MFFSSALRRRAKIPTCLCERSLARVLRSVTLAVDKARNGSWLGKGLRCACACSGKAGIGGAACRRDTQVMLLGRVSEVCIERRVRDGRRLCAGDRPGNYVEQGDSLQPRQRDGGGGPAGIHAVLPEAWMG